MLYTPANIIGIEELWRSKHRNRVEVVVSGITLGKEALDLLKGEKWLDDEVL